MEKVGKEVREYIEKEILPKYEGLGGHTDEHIQTVIRRSLEFAKQAVSLNIDMVYIIAAYHDLGRLIDNETHNIESAKMMRADEFLKSHFSAEEIETMAEAVEDHRASLGREPRSIYGKLVSSADRDSSYEVIMCRVYDYTKHLHPEMEGEELLEECRFHLREKYAHGGYALKTMYFEDPDFMAMVEKTEEITKDMKAFAPAMQEINQKRGLEV
jgi:uncharacterized protein